MAHPEPAGAYGFRLVPADPDVELPDLVAVADDAPAVTVEWAHASAVVTQPERVDGGRFAMANRRGGALEVRREPAHVRCVVPYAVSPAGFVHPVLALPMALLAWWRGDVTLHGGAFAAGGRAWVVCGTREAGKSSLLAALGARGVPVVADDLVVVAEGQVHAGPRCVDLRADGAVRRPGAQSIGVVGDRERFRLRTPPAPARLPLGGLLLLEWAHDGPAGATPLRLDERLQLLHRQHYAVPAGPPRPEATLALLDAPMWRFRRPRDWARADAALDQLLELTAGA